MGFFSLVAGEEAVSKPRQTDPGLWSPFSSPVDGCCQMITKS